LSFKIVTKKNFKNSLENQKYYFSEKEYQFKQIIENLSEYTHPIITFFSKNAKISDLNLVS
jgi:hypothetical protein